MFESHLILSTTPMAAIRGDSVISAQGSNAGGILRSLLPFSKEFFSFFSFPRFESDESNWLIENAEGALATGLVGKVLVTGTGTGALSSILSSSTLSSLCEAGDVLSPSSPPVADSTPLVHTSAFACCNCACDGACSSCSLDLRLTGEFCWRVSASKPSLVFIFSS